MKHKFESFCKDYENIENYKAAKKDNFKCWDCHHRIETHLPNGERREVDVTRDEMKALGMYYNRPAEELIFLTRREHNTLHHKGKTYLLGKHHSKETKNKMSEARKGKHWYNNGKENKFCYECPEGFVAGMLK